MMHSTEPIAEHLPFSEEEFYRAFRLVLAEKKAREGAAFVVKVVHEADQGAEHARLARERGSQNLHELQIPVAVIPDDAFALLALVSDDLRARVDAYMASQREDLREQWLRNGLYRPGGIILREPTPEVYAEVEARIARAAAEWRELCETTRAEVERRQQRRG
jgi:hypothetical protein